MLGRAKTEQRSDATVCSRPSVAPTFGAGRTNAV
jgi:hypothetical protein